RESTMGSDLPRLRCAAARSIRQEPRAARCWTSSKRGDTAGGRRGATRRAGRFCRVGSSKASTVLPIRPSAILLPTRQNRLGAGGYIWPHDALITTIAYCLLPLFRDSAGEQAKRLAGGGSWICAPQ